METIDIKAVFETIFKNGYQLGKKDGLDGMHICPNVIFDQFVRAQSNEHEFKLIMMLLSNGQAK